ncbi:hypothetical protein DR096_03845, partial [Mycoplasma hyopneumoniae]|nr:hypothetical protein [Mesomycoplasma hyopneumoniae]
KQFGIWRMNVIPNFKNAKEFEKYLLENEVVEQPNSMNRMIFKPNKSFRDIRKIEIKGLWLDGYISINGVSQTFPRSFRFDLP